MLILLENESYPYDRRVRHEAEALTEAGYEVTVVSPKGARAQAAEEVHAGVRVLRYTEPPSGTGALAYLREYGVALLRLAVVVRRLARERPFEAVIACNPPDFLLFLGEVFRRKGAAVVFDYHDPSPELFEAKFERRGLLYRLLLAVERLAFRRADVVMTVNDACAEIVAQRGRIASSRVFVVRNGPNPSRLYPVEPLPELRRGRPHLVVWIGRISQKEGLDGLIDAVDELVSRGRADLAFSIVGPGDAREELIRAVARRGLEGVIDFPGTVDDDMLRAYLSTADVCLSVDERNDMNDRSLMIKVLEYMLMERAVVQYPLEEMVRVCGDSTLYARNADPRDLANKIETLVDDPALRARLGAAARNRVLDGLTWPQQIPTLLEAVGVAVGPSAPRFSGSSGASTSTTTA